MVILGINLAHTNYGKQLHDGGTCFVDENGILVALAEERAARQKGAGGFEQSLQQCSLSLGLTSNDVDLVVYSTCCESTVGAAAPALPGHNTARIVSIPSHHLSHAYSAFLVSPFDEAIIMVLDSGGNVLDGEKEGMSQWWKLRREQQSYYVGRGTSIDLLERDFVEPYETGIGELYRAFTKYLGWESYIYSGKTMGLSAFGTAERFHGQQIFYFEGNHLKSRVVNNPLDPIGMLERYATENGISFGKPRRRGEPIDQFHMDIARYIQEQAEEAVIKKVRRLCKQTELTDLCVGGGVGLNCLINMKILERTPLDESLYNLLPVTRGNASETPCTVYSSYWAKRIVSR